MPLSWAGVRESKNRCSLVFFPAFRDELNRALVDVAGDREVAVPLGDCLRVDANTSNGELFLAGHAPRRCFSP